MAYGVVYKYTCAVNQKVYVGQTRTALKTRWRVHCSLRNVTLFGRAIRKHGPANFQVEILAEANSREELDLLEILFIAASQANDPRFGYNCKSGGIGDRILRHPEEHRAHLREFFKNLPRTEEWRRNIGRSHRGWIPSTLTRERQAASMRAMHAAKKARGEKLLGVFTSERAAELNRRRKKT